MFVNKIGKFYTKDKIINKLQFARSQCWKIKMTDKYFKTDIPRYHVISCIYRDILGYHVISEGMKKCEGRTDWLSDLGGWSLELLFATKNQCWYFFCLIFDIWPPLQHLWERLAVCNDVYHSFYLLSPLFSLENFQSTTIQHFLLQFLPFISWRRFHISLLILVTIESLISGCEMDHISMKGNKK